MVISWSTFLNRKPCSLFLEWTGKECKYIKEYERPLRMNKVLKSFSFLVSDTFKKKILKNILQCIETKFQNHFPSLGTHMLMSSH